jgi:CheY-like chemotaxis protein
VSTSNRKILVIEDDPDGQVMIATLLESITSSVDIAANAEEAEGFLFQSGNIYDAAIIDLALPDKDGWQILSSILADSRTATLPCIAATAFHTSKLREDAMLAGFKAYFSKPIDETKFVPEIARLLS